MDTHHEESHVACHAQGLGKTVTVIALILSAPAPNMAVSISAQSDSEGSGTDLVSPLSSESGRTDNSIQGYIIDSADSGHSMKEDAGVSFELAMKDPWDRAELCGGTLIVVPTSLLHQWHRELHDKVTNRSGKIGSLFEDICQAYLSKQVACSY